MFASHFLYTLHLWKERDNFTSNIINNLSNVAYCGLVNKSHFFQQDTWTRYMKTSLTGNAKVYVVMFKIYENTIYIIYIYKLLFKSSRFCYTGLKSSRLSVVSRGVKSVK